ncbi:MAG: hypothetical protein Q8R96_14100 [Bacteroidota bacterium]|nr:hypothetical protein [Bacteroidota bacterium]
MTEIHFAITNAILTGVVILFQFCLSIGLPWGAASMGGKYPGVYPKKMRIVALVNMIILTILMMIVLVNAGLILPQFMSFSEIAIWFVVVFYAIGTVLNTITPSKIERIWAPVAAIQLITTIMVAIK